MKLCMECYRELFNFDTKCDKCGSSNLLEEKEVEKIKNDLKNAGPIKLKRLLKNEKYVAIQNYLEAKENSYCDAFKSDPVMRAINKPENNRKPVNAETDFQTNQYNKTKVIVTCPYCKSTDTKKITVTSKAIHTAAFGIFSIGRNSKQWHCNNCKSDF